jgi:hypothetical protein
MSKTDEGFHLFREVKPSSYCIPLEINDLAIFQEIASTARDSFASSLPILIFRPKFCKKILKPLNFLAFRYWR